VVIYVFYRVETLKTLLLIDGGNLHTTVGNNAMCYIQGINETGSTFLVSNNYASNIIINEHRKFMCFIGWKR
jgi:hypothetical protein